MRRAGLVLALAAGVAGCNAPGVTREAETGRFRSELAVREAAIDVKPGEVLTMARCEAIALANSLRLSVDRQTLRLQDNQVRLALSDYFPSAQLNYMNQLRSNSNEVNQGGFIIEADKPHQQMLTINATVPVLDFGVTYFGYKIAEDRRTQEMLVLRRTEQQLRRDVKVAYARHASELRQIVLQERNVKAGEEVLRVAESLLREGLATTAEAAVVRAALAQAQVDLSHARQKAAETRMILAHLMSLPPGMAVTIDDAMPQMPPPPTPEAMAAYEEHALRVRPELHGQDLNRHISGNLLRQQVAGYFPKLDAIGSFNWSNNAFLVNPAYFLGGMQVAQALLDFPTRTLRVQQAQIVGDIEKERSLLLALGVLYEVDLRAVQLQQGYESIRAIAAQEAARQEAFNRILGLYREGLENEAATAQELAELSQQAAALDRARTDYQVWWYEFEAAALPGEAPPLPPPAKAKG